MTIFECKACNFITHLRSNYNRHLETEKHNRKELTVAKVEEVVTKIVTKTENGIKCDYCDKTFLHTQSMYRHMKHRCKKKDVVTLTMQLKEAKQKIKLLQKKIPINHTTINNTTNNTVNIQNIVAYKDTDTSHLTKNDYAFCVKQPDGVRHLIEKIHFNPMKPENKNLTITNLTDKYMMIYDGTQWKKVLKDELNKIYNQKENLLEEWVEQDPTLREKFYQYIKNERKDVYLHRIEDIKLMMYNQKPVVIV